MHVPLLFFCVQHPLLQHLLFLLSMLSAMGPECPTQAPSHAATELRWPHPVSFHQNREDEIAVETLRVFGKAAYSLFKEITRYVKYITEDDMAHQHFVQHMSVAVQKGNAAQSMGVHWLGKRGEV